MRTIKLSVLSLFLLFSFVFLGFDFRPGRVIGQSAGEILPAPNGVSASDAQYANKVGIWWETVRGATLYRIFRNTSNDSGSAVDVGTTAANYFFDPSAAIAQPYYYWVRAENAQTNSSLSQSDAGLRAAGTDNPGPPFPPLEPPPVPAGNQITATKAYLGKALFWDEQLSSTKTVSCGTCHRPAEGGSDPRTSAATRHPGFDNTFGTLDDVFGSPGVPQNHADGTYSPAQHFGMGIQVTNRRSPSYLNAGYTTDGLFWDGRARDQFRDPITNIILLNSFGGLESQSVGPPLSSAEMGHVGRDWTSVVSRVAASKPLVLAADVPSGLATWINGRGYPELFEEAFGTSEITPARIAMAIATHERTLFSDQAPIDRWAAELEPLTPQEEEGKDIFQKVDCTFCHGGSLLTNSSFQNVGVRPTTEDPGRGGITGIPDDNGRFKTPPLRNLELRAPYMHNGRFATIEEVVEFYNRGGDFDAANVDIRIRPLNLTTEQKAALAAFLKRPLTDLRVANELPPFDRPTLYTETDRVPEMTGTGRSGTGGIVPNAIAIEPPLVGNPSFTVAVSESLGGAQAVVVISSADPGVGTVIPASGTFARATVTLAGDGHGSINFAIPNNPALVGQKFYGRWYVPDPSAANGFSVSRCFTFTVFGDGAAPSGSARGDFDDDGKTDFSVWRPSDGNWHISRSTDGYVSYSWGASGDQITPGDYDNDGNADVAVYRQSTGTWFILNSATSTYSTYTWGGGSDVAVAGDYDDDGMTDVAVRRPSTGEYFILKSSGGTQTSTWGNATDTPVVGDFDGDGQTDLAVWRSSTGEWFINRSTAGTVTVTWGAAGDRVVHADYDGDGKDDVAVWRGSTGTWFILNSNGGTSTYTWGAAGDVPVPGNYDGDARDDIGVFRNGVWHIDRTTGGYLTASWGIGTDRAVPAGYIP